MKMVRWSIGGREYYMAYTVEAMLELEEEFGEVGEMIEKLSTNSREGMAVLVKCMAVLSREGEAVRRIVGYEAGEIPREEEIRVLIAPNKRVELASAVAEAVSKGLLTEVEEEEVDLVLLEIQKKTEILVRVGKGQEYTR